jgi:anti-sigma factor RsiW
MDQPNENLCQWLDAFLDDELRGKEATRFEAHLTQCHACQEAFEQQGWIDAGLLLDAATSPPAPAAVLTTAAETIVAIHRQQRVRRLIAGSLAAAASLALLAAWQFSAPGSAGGSASLPNDVVQRDATRRQSRGLQEERSTPAKSVATFTAGGGGIAIPIASDSPEVTVVQFYSTTEADRRMQRQRELEAKYQELIGG